MKMNAQIAVAPNYPVSIVLNDSDLDVGYRILTEPSLGTFSKEANRYCLPGSILTYVPGNHLSLIDVFRYSNESYLCTAAGPVISTVSFIYPNLSLPSGSIYTVGSNATYILANIFSFQSASNHTFQLRLFSSIGTFNSTGSSYLSLNGSSSAIQCTLNQTYLNVSHATELRAAGHGMRIELFGVVYEYIHYRSTSYPLGRTPASTSSATLGVEIIYFLVTCSIFVVSVITFLYSSKKYRRRRFASARPRHHT